MAGFPVRALDVWQRVLVEAGLQLAICNQQPFRTSVIHTVMCIYPVYNVYAYTSHVYIPGIIMSVYNAMYVKYTWFHIY